MKTIKIKTIWITLLLLLCTTYSIKASDIAITLSTASPKQGNTIKISINSNTPVYKTSVFFNKRFLPLFQKKPNSKKRWSGYLGISRYAAPGKHPITFRVYQSPKKFKDYHKVLYVKKAHFKKSIVKLPPKKKKIAKKKIINNESSIMAESMKEIIPKPFFTRPFIRPARGRRSSPFGAYRSYLGKGNIKKHSGVDYANKIGSPIIACNTGKVVFSKALKSHGKTIIINHGVGIFSLYTHLHELIVQTGDFVKRGQLIGKIGNTGISTGPHLHWGISVYKTRVDPEQWLRDGYLYNY